MPSLVVDSYDGVLHVNTGMEGFMVRRQVQQDGSCFFSFCC